MRIAFDVSSCAKRRRGGIATYGWELLRALRRVAPHHELVLALRPRRWSRRRLLDGLLEERARPRLLLDAWPGLGLGGRVDVLHGIGVRLPPRGRFGRVLTVHDVNVFERPELSSPDWLRKRRARIRESVARADLVIASSEHGARALCEHLRVPRAAVRVVPMGVDLGRFRDPGKERVEAVLARLGLAGRPFVLHVGQAGPRKNQAGLVDAFACSGLPDAWRLVLVGPRGEDARALRERARERGLAPERLVLPGWVGDEELPALLAGAGVFAFPSLHEGFGLPVLEAQACGAPVVASDRAALPESVGEVGLLAEPTDPEAFGAALRRAAEDEALRERLRREGPRRAAGFAWERVARDTLAVLEEAAARRR